LENANQNSNGLYNNSDPLIVTAIVLPPFYHRFLSIYAIRGNQMN